MSSSSNNNNNNNDEKDPNNPTKSSVSLKDVLRATPAEDEAQTRMLRNLEKGESSHQEQQQASSDIDHAVAAAIASTDEAPLDDDATVDSVEDALAGYAKQMHTQNVKHGGTSFRKSSNSARFADPLKSVSKADPNDFARSAAKLMRRSAGLTKNNVRHGNRQEQELSTLTEFKSFLAFRQDSFWHYFRAMVLYSVLPFGGLAAILFYFADNPGGHKNDKEAASISWWLIFVFVRQVVTLSLAKVLEVLLIDFLAVNTKVCMNLVGPFFTLMLVQSKGWAFQGCAWALFDLCLLYGNSDFARHWLFYQNAIDLFNKENPAGRVLEQDIYRNLILLVVVVTLAVSLKKFFLGLWYGQSVYRRYGKDLADLMKKALLIQKVAALAKDQDFISKARKVEVDQSVLSNQLNQMGKTTKDISGNEAVAVESERAVDPDKVLIDMTSTEIYAGTGELTSSQKQKIAELLGEFEEPMTDEIKQVEKASISAVVNFRAAMSTWDRAFPFSVLFGPAGTREECIESAQKLYLRLDEYDGEKDGALKFNLLAAVALKKDGTLNEAVLRDLISVFRPTRDGDITILDFVKSVDQVYKDLKLLQASIASANKMNAASQSIVDAVFNFVLACVALSIIGVNPTAFFGGLVAFVVGFAFMIGGATSKWFEGVLFILVRKPYDVGDRISVSGVEDEVSGGGSAGWIVKDLTLYHTTVIFGTTLEEATYSNGSLAGSRIINHNRSPKAVLNFLCRFGINTPKEKVAEFEEKVKDFVKERPREWVAFSAFRLSNVAPELGYVEYKVIIQHRESWQQIGALLNSKAEVQLFAYELAKEMDMGYENPAMPIILRGAGDSLPLPQG